MTTTNSTNYSVSYYPNMVVLRGETRNIHMEAYKILMRFRSSAVPYAMTRDSDNLIELSARA